MPSQWTSFYYALETTINTSKCKLEPNTVKHFESTATYKTTITIQTYLRQGKNSKTVLAYLPSLMALIVCDFYLLEGDFAGHPVLARGGRLGMHVLQQILAVCFSLPDVDPLGVDVLVSSVVHWVEF